MSHSKRDTKGQPLGCPFYFRAWTSPASFFAAFFSVP